ncbi:SPOR domain-containing protein [Trinickia symbiotica]|uniref:SPOR domain-containing protein n=1 Tax=Trinickia symbiotica TaxID=863227 RepID=A0A2T3XLW8_9BURK|nr:SPOR domain-containing protein [Trinickia symbiotica]PTB17469.1 SPOR domain-containing protein [Trinickia symbiotica]
MGFFSFGNKDDAPRRRGGNAKSSARGEPRRRRTERSGESAAGNTGYDADAMLLDPTLPEKQRARRRLVGAIALVIAAVVVLPMVLDSHPKPVTDDIAIDIPNRPVSVPRRAADDQADTQAGVAPDSDTGAQAAAGVTPPGADAGKASEAQASTQSKAEQSAHSTAQAQSTKSTQSAKPATPPQPTARAGQSAQQAPVAPVAKPQAQTQAQTAKPTPMPAPSAANADSGTPAAPPGARFAVQLGVFSDDASARRWESKLKAAGVPAYIENRKQADGSTRALLRAGPFPDRAAASAAIAKVREAGLTANAAQ